MNKILHKNLLKSLEESINIPSGKEFYSLPDLYVCAHVPPQDLVNGWDRQFQTSEKDNDGKGGGGEMYGKGTYTSMTEEGGKRCFGYYGYGIFMYKAKLRDGFKHFLFFNLTSKTSYALRKGCYEAYRSYNLTLKEQLERNNVPPNVIARMESYERNDYYQGRGVGRHQEELYEYGIRGICYDWGGGHECCIPWDTTAIIPYAYSIDQGNHWHDLEEVPVIKDRDGKAKAIDYGNDTQPRQQFHVNDIIKNISRKADMRTQLCNVKRGHFRENYSSLYDAVFVAVCKNSNYKWNILKADNERYKPTFVSPIDFDCEPDISGLFGNDEDADGYYIAQVQGITIYGRPEDGEGTPAGFYNEFTGELNTWNNFSAYVSDYNSAKNAMEESLSKSLRANLKEAFDEGLHGLRMPDKNEMVNGGKVRYIYRCCHLCDLDSIMDKGQLRQFAGNNDGFWYGNGVYCNIKLDGARNGSYNTGTPATGKRHPDGYKYGSCILKCALLGGFKNFLIFDETLAKHYYKEHYQLRDQVYAILPKDKADWLWNKMEGIMRVDYVKSRWGMSSKDHFETQCEVTTGMPHSLFPNKGLGYPDEEFYALFQECDVRGIVYHGGNDGYSCVVYNYDECIPVAYSTDHGTTFHTDKYNHDKTIERLQYDNDPIMKFGYAYKKIKWPIAYISPFDGHKTGISLVQLKNNEWNYLDIQTGKTILPFNLKDCPDNITGIGEENGRFDVKYNGEVINCYPEGFWDKNVENEDGSYGSWMTWDAFK